MDISNRTLSIFVLAALVVTLVSTSLTLNEMNRVRNRILAGAPSYTGLATGTGNVTVTISTSLNMSILNRTIFFGVGVVSTNCSNATLQTNGSNFVSHDNCTFNTCDGLLANFPSTTPYGDFGGVFLGTNNSNIKNCWLNFTDNGSSLGHAAPILINQSGIIIRNDGNVNMSITMDSGDDTAAAFIGGGANYNFTVNEQESGSCPTGSVVHMHQNWMGVNSSSDIKICDNLKYQDSTDAINMTFRVLIPSNVSPGEKQDTLTFTSATT